MSPVFRKSFWKYNSDIFKLHEPDKNIYVIKPASKISSYKLLMNADKVISYNSLMGIEAVYWGKPSILLGRRPYENLEVVYKPKNHLSVMNLIFKENLLPKNKLGAIKYASFWVEGGFTLPNFSGSMSKGYKFKKKNLRIRGFDKFFYYFAKIIQYYFYNYLINYKIKNFFNKLN